VETTGFAVINWINQNKIKYASNIQSGIEFILSMIKSQGLFGSTQATILGLQALIKYSEINNGLRGSGDIALYFNEEKVGYL
jgi:hypothetical protein